MRVQVIKEVKTGDPLKTEQWELCYQWCLWVYDDGGSQNGFRFIWRRPDNSLQPARGQARIPSASLAIELINRAKKEGWGNNVADD